jgi:hypothetical protein
MPTITRNPPSFVTACGSSSISISLAATNATAYQWSKDGVSLVNGGSYSNVNTPELSITNPTAAVVGVYACWVSNGLCGIMTNAVSVDFIETPIITSNPASCNPCTGTNVDLKVTATGPGLGYQWYKGGVALTESSSYYNVNSAAVTLRNCTSQMSGSYYCVVYPGTQRCSATSASAIVTVRQAPVITSQPPQNDNIWCSGYYVSMPITATNATSYSWFKDGVELTESARYKNVHSSALVMPNIGPDMAGSYMCTAFNGNCSVNSLPMWRAVNPTMIISQQPQFGSCEDPYVYLNVSVLDIGHTLLYQWYKNGVVLTDNYRLVNGAQSPNLSLFNTSNNENFTGNFYCVITDQVTGCTVQTVTVPISCPCTGCH